MQCKKEIDNWTYCLKVFYEDKTLKRTQCMNIGELNFYEKLKD